MWPHWLLTPSVSIISALKNICGWKYLYWNYLCYKFKIWLNKNGHGRDRPYKKKIFFFFWYLNRRENLESGLPFLLFWFQTYMPVLCHYTDLVISVVMHLFLSHPDFAIRVFSFLFSPMLWSPPLECVSYSGTAYISFDRNTALANLPFFLMLHCFLLFLQNNSIILSFPFLVINFSRGLPSISEYHFLPISWSRKNTYTHKWSFSTIVIYSSS